MGKNNPCIVGIEFDDELHDAVENSFLSEEQFDIAYCDYLILSLLEVMDKNYSKEKYAKVFSKTEVLIKAADKSKRDMIPEEFMDFLNDVRIMNISIA